MIWVCSTGAAIAMQRWAWAGQTGVGPQASKRGKDTACKVMMDASMASGSHPLVLLGCIWHCCDELAPLHISLH